MHSAPRSMKRIPWGVTCAPKRRQSTSPAPSVAASTSKSVALEISSISSVTRKAMLLEPPEIRANPCVGALAATRRAALAAVTAAAAAAARSKGPPEAGASARRGSSSAQGKAQTLRIGDPSGRSNSVRSSKGTARWQTRRAPRGPVPVQRASLAELWIGFAGTGGSSAAMSASGAASSSHQRARQRIAPKARASSTTAKL
mmetsp:Transcript_66025/g.190472  ORF Transcript_66025/g.190472 Transcript_66025/m.190472 type:complete len:201 (-) Transcript_66025:1120-1722(-)